MCYLSWVILASYIVLNHGYTIIQRPVHLNGNHLNYNYNRFVTHLGRPASPPGSQWFTPPPFVAATPAPLSRNEVQHLLELYYLIQMITLYRRAAPRRTKLDNLVEQLKDDYFEQQLRDLLHEVEGFDELAILGSHAYDRLEPWNMLDKGRFVNDYRQLIPALHRVLDVIEVDNYADEDFREKLKQLKRNVEGVTVDVIQKEMDVLKELDLLKLTTEKPWTINDILAVIFGKQGQEPINDFDENYDIVEDDDDPVDDGKVEEFWVVIDDSNEDSKLNEVKPEDIDIRQETNVTLEEKTISESVTEVSKVEPSSVVPSYILDRYTERYEEEAESTSGPQVLEVEEKSDHFEFKAENYENHFLDNDESEARESTENQNNVESEPIAVETLENTPTDSHVENRESETEIEVAETFETTAAESNEATEIIAAETKEETSTDSNVAIESPIDNQLEAEENVPSESKTPTTDESETITQLQNILENPGSFPKHYDQPNVMFESEKLPQPIDVSAPAVLIEPKEVEEPFDVVEQLEEDEVMPENQLDNLSETGEAVEEKQMVDKVTAAETAPLWISEAEDNNNLEGKSMDQDDLDQSGTQEVSELKAYEIHSEAPAVESQEQSEPISTAHVDEDVRRYVADEVDKVLNLLEESHGTGVRSMLSAEDLDRIAANVHPVEDRDIDEEELHGVGRIALLSALQDLMKEKDDEESSRMINVLELWKQGEDLLQEDGYFETNYGTKDEGIVEGREIEEDGPVGIVNEDEADAAVELIDELERKIEDDVEFKLSEEQIEVVNDNLQVEEPNYELKEETVEINEGTADIDTDFGKVEQTESVNIESLADIEDSPSLSNQSLNTTSINLENIQESVSSNEITDDQIRGNLQPFPEELPDETEPLEMDRARPDEEHLEEDHQTVVLPDELPDN